MPKTYEKLGNSTRVIIGKKSYSSYDIPHLKPQTKQINLVTGLENAPRNLSNKTIENQANTIKTNNSAPTESHYKSFANNNKEKSGITTENKSTVHKEITAPPQAQNTSHTTKTDAPTPNVVTPDVKLNSLENTDGGRGETSKTSVQPLTVQTGSEKQERIESSIIRQSNFATPQTVIQGKEVESGYKRPTGVTTGVQTGESITDRREANAPYTARIDTPTPSVVIPDVKLNELERTDGGRVETLKTSVQPLTVQTGSERQEHIESSIIRQSDFSTPQTIIQGKEIESGYKRPTGVTTGIQTGESITDRREANTPYTAKTSVQPLTVQTGSERQEHIESSIIRQSDFSTPQTIIQGKEVESGYKRPTGVTTGIQTGESVTDRREANTPYTAKTDTLTPNVVTPDVKLNELERTDGGRVETLKTSIQPLTVQTGSERQERIESSIIRQSDFITPQTIIQGKEVESGYKRPTGVITGIQTGESITDRREANTQYTAKTDMLKPSVQTNIQTGNETNEKIVSNIQRQSSVIVTPQTIFRKPPVPVAKGFNPLAATGNVVSDIKNKFQGELNNQDDSGTATVSTMISMSGVVVKSFKTSQAAAPYVINAVKKTAKGTYEIGKTTVKVVKTADSTIALIKSGVIPLNKQTMIQFRDFALQKIKTTKPIQQVLYAVNNIKTGIYKTKQTAVKIGKGAYKIGKTTVKVVKTVDSKIAMIQHGVIPFNKQTMIQFRDFALRKIKTTKPMQRVIHTVNIIKTGVYKARQAAIKIGERTVKTLNIVRGVINGSVKIQISKDMLKNFKLPKTKNILQPFKKPVSKIIKYTGKPIVKGIISGAKTGVNITRFSFKNIGKGVSYFGDTLSASGDTGAQAIGLSIKTANYTIKAVKNTPKIVKGTVKGVKTVIYMPIKTISKIRNMGRGVKGAAKMVSKTGFKNTARHYGNKVLQAIQKAGNSVVSSAIQLLKTVGSKVAVPLLLLVFVVVAITSVISAPVAGVGAIFGNVFSIFDSSTGTFTDFEIRDYVKNAIVSKRIDYVNKIVNIRNTNLIPTGTYHYIRLFTPSDEMIDITETDILNKIYSADELACIIEPLFNTIIFTKYDLEPTQDQTNATLNEIWDALMKIDTRELPIERCTTAPHSDCGAYIANIATCPNYSSGSHSSYTCSICCWRQYDYASGLYIDRCNGYYHCNGHKILGVYIVMDGIDELLDKYFLDPINQLESLATRTAAQEEELQTLKDNYDLCLTYMEDVIAHYGI